MENDNDILELEEALKLKLKSLESQQGLLKNKIQKDKARVLKFQTENKLMFFGKPGYGHLGALGTWEPNCNQEFVIKEIKDTTVRIMYMVGANRISKTFTFLGIVVTLFMLGRFPWEDESVGTWFWKARKWKTPIKVRIGGQDWENHIKGTVVETLKELVPKSLGLKPKKNTLGVEFFWVMPRTGNTIEILSNNSDSAVWESWHGHAVFWDEPPTRKNRIAATRGLIDFGGMEFFGMTLLKEAWVDREVLNRTLKDGSPDKSIRGIISDISSNIGHGITQENVDHFAKDLTPEEHKARIDGIPAYKQGLVLFNFNKIRNGKKRFEIPYNWPIDVAIDRGLTKPHDVTFLAISPNNFKYLIYSFQVVGSGTEVGEAIIKKMVDHNLSIYRVIGDPYLKAGQENEKSMWDQIDDVLSTKDLYLEGGSKDKEEGIIQTNEAFLNVHNEPTLLVFNDCVLAIREFESWMYDDAGKPIKPKRTDMIQDNQCENLYRLILLGTKYEDYNYRLYDDKEEDESDECRNETTGY